MRSYFITVRDFESAIAVDPLAKYIRTLPATKFVYGYCCRESTSHPVPPAYIYQVRVSKRSQAEDASGVIRCRAQEPAEYKKFLHTWVC